LYNSLRFNSLEIAVKTKIEKNPKIKCFFWDFDGTVLGSEWFQDLLYQFILRPFLDYRIIQFALKERRECGDYSAKDGFKSKLEKLLKAKGVTIDVEAMVKFCSEWSMAVLKQSQHPEEFIRPEVRTTLEYLNQRGIRLGIASLSRGEEIREKLEILKLSDFFPEKYIVGRGDVPFRKPHPGMYRRLLEIFDTQPENAVAVEDTVNGVKSATGAGMEAIFFLDTPLDKRYSANDYFDKVGFNPTTSEFLRKLTIVEPFNNCKIEIGTPIFNF